MSCETWRESIRINLDEACTVIDLIRENVKAAGYELSSVDLNIIPLGEDQVTIEAYVSEKEKK